MKLPSLLVLAVLVVSAAVAGGPLLAAQSPSADAFPNKSITIYVTDFDLEATHAAGSSGNSVNRSASAPVGSLTSAGTTSAPAVAVPTSSTGSTTSSASAAVGSGAPGEAQKSDGPKSESPRADTPGVEGEKGEAAKGDASKTGSSTDDSPRAQAAKLVDLTSTTLVKVLEQSGYSVRRLRSGAAPPDSGVILRGVFAQVDASFGIRRMVIGGVATDPKMQLFVGIGNLSRPEQTLYAVISPQPADNLGPLISVSAYAPIGRYELDSDPSEDLLRRTATNIAGDLTRLLNANPLALEQ
jgi:hypothetical protein